MKLIANKLRPIGRNTLEYRNSKGELISWMSYRDWLTGKTKSINNEKRNRK